MGKIARLQLLILVYQYVGSAKQPLLHDANAVFPEDAFNYPTDTTSFAKCQLLLQVSDYDIIKRFGSIKAQPFREIIEKINETVFGIS